MQHLIYTGPSNTGKTTLVNRTVRELIRLDFVPVPYNPSFNDEATYRIPNNEQDDSFILLTRNDVTILCYSWSDTESLILWLKRLLDRLKSVGIIPDLIVMASRDASENLYQFTRSTFNLNSNNSFEVPLGRMVRGERRNRGVRWYLTSIELMVNQFILPRIIEGL